MIIPLLFRVGFRVALCGFCAGVASAQTTRPAPPSGAVHAQISFLLIAGAKPVEGIFFAGPGKATVPVTLGNVVKSRLHSYEGPSPLVLFVPDAKVPLGRVPLATVPLPASASRLLVLLAPSGKSGPGEEIYRGMAIEDDAGSMPPGSVRFLNYSGKSVAVKVGTEVVNLGKGPSKAFAFAKGASAAVEMPIQVASQEEGGGFEKAFSSTLRLKPDERQTFILLPSTHAKGRGIVVVPSRDLIAPPPAKPVPRT